MLVLYKDVEIKNPWWCHRMETFPCYWLFVQGIHRSPVNSPHKGQWRGALCFLWSAPWISGWVNNHEAGGLRRHHAHYDVIVMPIHLPKRLFAVWHDGSLSSQAKEFATNVSKPCIIYRISHWCGPINRLPPCMWSVKFTYTWSCPNVYMFQSSTALFENTKCRKSTLILVWRGS